MKEQISWDQSLVKKFSSSNHYKLLNQLRTEVKKYPLNNKRTKSLKQVNDSKIDNNNNQTKTSSQDENYSINSFPRKDKSNNNNNVSFNNSKNFSIYNNTSNDSKRENKDTNQVNLRNSNKEATSFSFKERLNQVDMK